MDAIIAAFASGKGGTGKSTVATLVGAQLAAQKHSVLLVELSPHLRSLDVIAGVGEQVVFDLEDILSGRTTPARAVVESPVYPGLSVIPAALSGGVILPESVELLCARFLDQYEYILLDVGCGFGDAFSSAAGVANRFYIVATPDPVSLRSARLMVEMLEEMPIELRLLLNRVDPQLLQAEGVLRDLDEAVDTVGVRLLGVVPESAAIRAAAETGRPLPKSGTEHKVFAAIAKRILGSEVPLVIQ